MPSAKILLLLLAMATGFPLLAQTANRFDVVITEIMADPTPVVGLPNAEYLELRNVSSTALALNGWRISDATGTATINALFVLPPDSTVLLCANSNVAALSSYGKTIGISSFPSLDNEGEILTLRSPQNKIIHAVHYSSEWYGNEVKKGGGWSLEMIDPKNPCSGKDNWKGSNSISGGTPGRLNSINAKNNDNTPPRAKRAFAIDSTTMILVYDEPLDSSSAATLANYSLPGLTVASVTPLPPLFQSVQLRLSTPLQRTTVYHLTLNNITDCLGNQIGVYNKVKVGLPERTGNPDLVINEILFNPRPGAFDFVEFYNKSQKIFDASTLYIANRTSAGTVSSPKKLSEEPFLFFPGDYLVVTENKESLAKEYLVKNEDAVMQLSSLPSFPDDKGTVVLLNVAGEVIDEVAYDKTWHFALLDNNEGISLERLSPDAPSPNKSSWHSAAATAGYGTPAYLNSQHKQTATGQAMIEISPNIFSPDHDGHDDLATIQYKLEERGFVANVTIFDAAGRLVRLLVKNELLGLTGFWKWDGLDEKMNKLPVGTYIIYTEIFHTEGKKKSFKNTIVLARRMN